MIRTPNDLSDRIDRDLVWRKKELTTLRSLVQSARGRMEARVLVRSAIALLYAHWEGFVRTTSKNYLEFVAAQRLTYSELAPNFVGLSLRAKLMSVSDSRKMSSANEIATFIVHHMGGRASIPYKDGVDANSNLSSKVLVDILDALGLDKTPFETRLAFLDTRLLAPRNHVAHGEEQYMEEDDYISVHDDVMGIIESFRTVIENATALETYRRR